MSPKVREFLESLRDLPLFGESFDASDINATNDEGENALHVAIHQNNNEAAKMLVEAGININQPGDSAHTPLHDAAFAGNLEIVRLLIERGADVFALDEGVSPFTMARYGGHEEICELIAAEMKKRQAENSEIRIQARICQLRREIDNLEQLLQRGKAAGT